MPVISQCNMQHATCKRWPVLTLLLGALSLRASRLSFAPPLPLPVALAVALAVAALDEAHQATTATRTGSPWDAALDAGGAVLGALLWRRLRPRR